MESGLVPVGAGVVMGWVGTLAVALTFTHIFGSALDKRIDKAELLSSSPI